jgi:hypothetical protein
MKSHRATTVYYLHFIYQNLERKKHIRCLRIANHKDPTLMPTVEASVWFTLHAANKAFTVTLERSLNLRKWYPYITCPHEGDGYRECSEETGRNWLVSSALWLDLLFLLLLQRGFPEAPQLQRYMRRLEKFAGTSTTKLQISNMELHL